jgi:membrane fusion protein (multidrug efflux system)
MLSVILSAACAGGGPKQPEKSGKPVVTVNAVVVVPRELEHKILSTGSIIANEEVELRSEIPGRIVAINFEEGSHVSQGFLLLKIDDRELQAQMRKLKVDEKQAREDLDRKEKLLALKAISQEEYDKAFNTLGIVMAQIDLVKTQISKTEIIAPFAGKIGLRQVSPGGYVSSSTLVARMQQTDPVKIDFAVPEKYLPRIRKGSTIRFRIEGTDSTFSGKIYAVEPKIDPVTRNVSLRAMCSNPREILTPGAFAKIEIVLDDIAGALVVPSEAIIPQLSGEKVFVAEKGKARSRLVRTGIRTEREVQILSGLNPGDTVITSGILQLREDTDIKTKLSK